MARKINLSDIQGPIAAADASAKAALRTDLGVGEATVLSPETLNDTLDEAQLEGGATLTALQGNFGELANAGGDPANVASAAEIRAATSGLLIVTPGPLKDAEADVTLTFTAGAATLDGSLGFNFAGTIVANSDVTTIQNLTDRTRRVKITASGATRTIAFGGAGKRYGFSTTVSISDGDSAVFFVWGTSTECVAFIGLEDVAAGGGGGLAAATTTQQLEGTSDAVAATPNTVAALWEQGSNIASAGTISIGEGGFFHVTGTTTITDVDFGTDKAGRLARLVFDGILTLTHNATTLILPTGANIVTAPGDSCTVVSEGSDIVRVVDFQRKDGTALAATGFTPATTTEQLAGTETTKGSTPDSNAALWEQGSNIASAGTISIGEGGYFHVTGTTTITDIDFAIDRAGRPAVLIFDGVLTLTNGANLILNTGANIVTAAGDMLHVWSEGSDVVRGFLFRASGFPLIPIVGQQTLWVPAGAMIPSTTSGAALETFETATNDVMHEFMAFDTAADEYAQFALQMPKSWDEGTLIYQVVWNHPTATTNFDVTFGLQATALANGEAWDVAWGTAVTLTDAGSTTLNALYISPESGPLTVAGSPAAEEYVIFRLYRDVDGNGTPGNDDLAVDARVLGVKIHYTTNAATDD